MEQLHTRPPTPKSGPKPSTARWTGEKASAFLKLLARNGSVAASARAVGMSRQSAYRLRARAPRFAAFWDSALEVARNTRASSRKGQRAVHPLLDPAPMPMGEGDISGRAG